MKRLWHISLGIITATLALIPGCLDLPCTIQTPGKVVPRQEWVLLRGPDGQLISTLSDHLQGRAESYAVTGFERSDHAHFQLHPSLSVGAAIAAGDTIGQIFSSESERQLTELRGQLAAELATLSLAQTGEKKSVIRAARLRRDQARVQTEQQRREVARLQALFDRDLVAAADLEIAATALKLDEIQIDIDAAQLQTALTGAREQEVEWIRARIAALQKEIDVLARRQKTATLRAPLPGCFVGALSGDTLAVIQDTTAYVILLPVSWKDRRQVTLEQQVEIRIDDSFEPLTGRIETLDRIAHTALNGRQFLNARALVDEVADLAPGLLVHCSIPCPPVDLLGYLWRFFTP